MKAALFKEKNLPLRFEEVATPIPSKGQVLVKLRAAALNHRDLWIQKEQAIPSASGIILGSDGSGIIDSVGEAVDENLIGQEVIMNPGIGWGKNPLVQSDAQFPSLLDLAMPGGRVVIFGRTAGDIPAISPRTLFWKQLSIFGTTMGTEDEFLSMIDFIHKHKIKPVVDKIFSLAKINDAFAPMEEGVQFGKIILKIL